MDQLIALDKELFLWLNSFHTPFWDQFFLVYTNGKSWLPVIVLLIAMLFKNFDKKQALIYIVLISAAVGLCDFIASGIMKPYFARLRPCHDYPNEMNLVGNCGGMFGFASSHASNAFGLFTSFVLVFKNNKKVFWTLLVWALLMCYSRIYVGVHHPGDIVVGAIIGMVIPNLFFYLYNKYKQPTYI